MSKEITQQEVKELLKLNKTNINNQIIRDLFAVYYGSDEPKFHTNDTLTLFKGDFYNKDVLKTTVGRLIFNIYALPEKYLKKYGFYNEVLTSKNLEALEDRMGDMVLNDEMDVKDYTQYLDYGEFLGMAMAYFILPSMNYNINTPIKEVIQKRNQLFNDYKKEVDVGDPNVTERIEKELISMAKNKLIEDKNPSYDYFGSGEFNFANNYKKSAIMGGAFIHPSTGKIIISKSNYSDGIAANEYPIFSNLTTAGAYARGVATQDGGAETKRLNKSLQATCLDDEGTDCGTELGVKVSLTDKNKNMFLYRYLIEDGKLVYLTSQNINSYVGKTVIIRSPLYCKGKAICSKCAGELLYKIGIKNAGLLTSTYSGILMNKSMKTFHDTSIKFNKIDFDKYIKEI